MDYFGSLDMPIFNCWGLSETTGPTTMGNPLDFDLASASKPHPGAHITIGNDLPRGEEGEVRVKGRHVMMGYKDNERATKEMIDHRGYLKTGDLGLLTEKGFLKITGRIKELIITAGGENVAPNPIEERFKTICPACSNIVLLGEGQRFIGAFITLKVDINMQTMVPTNNLLPGALAYIKEQTGLDNIKTSDEACKNEKVIQMIQKCIDQTNAKTVSRACQIKKFKLLPIDFTVSGNELTATMKVKRKAVHQKYKKEIDEMYAFTRRM